MGECQNSKFLAILHLSDPIRSAVMLSYAICEIICYNYCWRDGRMVNIALYAGHNCCIDLQILEPRIMDYNWTGNKRSEKNDASKKYFNSIKPEATSPEQV